MDCHERRCFTGNLLVLVLEEQLTSLSLTNSFMLIQHFSASATASILMFLIALKMLLKTLLKTRKKSSVLLYTLEKEKLDKMQGQLPCENHNEIKMR